MALRPLRLLLIGSLLVASGAHLAVLQSCAWASMALTSLRTATPFEADRPCSLCLKVRKGAQPGRGSLAAPAESKLDFLCLARASLMNPRRPLWTLVHEPGASRWIAPPVSPPPPRELPA